MVEEEKGDEGVMGWWRKLLEISENGEVDGLMSGLFEDFNLHFKLTP